jgi:hypothetical protein
MKLFALVVVAVAGACGGGDGGGDDDAPAADAGTLGRYDVTWTESSPTPGEVPFFASYFAVELRPGEPPLLEAWFESTAGQAVYDLEEDGAELVIPTGLELEPGELGYSEPVRLQPVAAGWTSAVRYESGSGVRGEYVVELTR